MRNSQTVKEETIAAQAAICNCRGVCMDCQHYDPERPHVVEHDVLTQVHCDTESGMVSIPQACQNYMQTRKPR